MFIDLYENWIWGFCVKLLASSHALLVNNELLSFFWLLCSRNRTCYISTYMLALQINEHVLLGNQLATFASFMKNTTTYPEKFSSGRPECQNHSNSTWLWIQNDGESDERMVYGYQFIILQHWATVKIDLQPLKIRTFSVWECFFYSC